ncbi:MAG: PD-(D/E)XK nuclease family protein [Proteobacteria bacterium]|nr:PD-(D/E)XK nuclease family protein [Pseudomonadota bacterium]
MDKNAPPSPGDPHQFCNWLADQDGVLPIPADEPFYQQAARSLRRLLAQAWPDAGHIQVLVPHGDARRSLTRELYTNEAPDGSVDFDGSTDEAPDNSADFDGSVGFGLDIGIIRQWALAQLPTATARFCSDDETLLALVARIRRHGGVRFNHNHWQFSPALTDLFSRLEQQRIGDEELMRAVHSRRKLWRLDENNYLAIEAKIAQMIWQAWREELSAKGYMSSVQAYNEALDKHICFEQGQRYWILAPDEPLPAERDLLRKAVQADNCQIVICDRRHSPAHADFQQRIDDSSRPLSERQKMLYQCFFGTDTPQPATTSTTLPAVSSAIGGTEAAMSLMRCTNEARQAEAIVELTLRARKRKERVAVVVHNRRFARALRATMDNCGLVLHDRTGWALSTTFGGSLIKIWLNVVGHGYGGDDVFNLLRTARPVFSGHEQSFFAAFDSLRDHLSRNFQIRFEPGVAVDNTTRPAPGSPPSDGIDPAHPAHPGADGRAPSAGGIDAAHPGVDVRAQAADWIKQIHRAGAILDVHTNSEKTVAEWCVLLEQSVREAGLWDLLLADSDGQGAGAVIIERIRRFQQPGGMLGETLPWRDFLSFIDHQLEHHHYAPPSGEAGADAELIQLGNILPEYDLLIFAAMEQDNFPGRFRADLLFNDDIYQQLGLQAPQKEREQKVLARFTEALLAPVPVVFAWSSDGDRRQPCAWLSQIIDNAELSGRPLPVNPVLSKLEHQWANELSRRERPLHRPSVVLPPAASAWLSVNDYQSLVDCPYRYLFQARLGARQSGRISQIMRSDIYGQIAHQCFKDFHDWLEAKKILPLTEQSLAQAISAADAGVENLFSGWMEGSLVNMTHKLRLRRTMRVYCQWLCRQNVTGVDAAEQDFALPVNAGSAAAAMTVRGRVDFLLKDDSGNSIVDFKSSAARYTVKAMRNGDDVQLITYALNWPEAEEIYYLAPASVSNYLNPLELKKISVPAKELPPLRTRNLERLKRVATAIAGPHTLTALAKEKVCAYCPYEAVCRPRDWAPEARFNRQ